MFKFFFMLTITLDVLIAPLVSGNKSTSSAHQTNSILPLVLIKTEDGRLIRPTDIPEPVTDDEGNILFGTKFSAMEEGKQLFFCGRALEDDANVTPDNQPCSYELSEPELTSGPDSESTSVRQNYLRCAVEPEPFVLKLTERNDSNEEKEVKTNDDDETHIFEVYRFCYDELKQRVLFTEHTITSPKLLDFENKLLENDRYKTYEMLVAGYGYFGKTFETLKNAYTEFNNEKEKKKWSPNIIDESLLTHKFSMSDQQFVPTEDMALAIWKKPTYHCLNAQAMNDEKILLWDHINELIREDAITKSREYLVYTGAFDVSMEGKDENELFQSPDLWIKLVYYKNENEMNNEFIAIVMIHNPKIQQVLTIFNDICKINVCGMFPEPFTTIGTSVCCTTSMEKVYFYFDLKSDDHALPLKINSLYNE